MRPRGIYLSVLEWLPLARFSLDSSPKTEEPETSSTCWLSNQESVTAGACVEAITCCCPGCIEEKVGLKAEYRLKLRHSNERHRWGTWRPKCLSQISPLSKTKQSSLGSASLLGSQSFICNTSLCCSAMPSTDDGIIHVPGKVEWREWGVITSLSTTRYLKLWNSLWLELSI